MSKIQNNLLGTSAFQGSVKVGALLSFLIAALVAAVSSGWIYQMDSRVHVQLDEYFNFLSDKYYTDGRHTVIKEELSYEERRIADEQYVRDVLASGSSIAALYDRDNNIVAGAPNINLGPENYFMDTVHFADQLFTLWFRRETLTSGEDIVVVHVTHPRRAIVVDVVRFWVPIGFAVGILFSTLLGLLLSALVMRRVAAITKASESFSHDNLDYRIPSSTRGDEFDTIITTLNRRLDEIADLTSNMEATSVGIAHDLRTPLTNIGGRLELLREDHEDPDAVLEHIEEIEDAQQELIGMFDALLRLGEIRSGNRKASFSVVDLSLLAKLMIEAYKPVFHEARKFLRVDIASKLTVLGDKEMIEQLLSNLLDNANRHSRVAAVVTVSLKSKNGAAVLTVGDDGPGMPPATRKRIFDRFYRAEHSRTTAGHGLGLSIVKAVADLHEAPIEIADDTVGAVFIIRFPNLPVILNAKPT